MPRVEPAITASERSKTFVLVGECNDLQKLEDWWRLLSYGIWHRVLCQVIANVSEESLYSEDAESKFFRHVENNQPDFTASHHSPRRENFKPWGGKTIFRSTYLRLYYTNIDLTAVNFGSESWTSGEKDKEKVGNRCELKDTKICKKKKTLEIREKTRSSLLI
jgi:hypothetical protein